MLQGNNKQKFARNFGFKMILAGGYRIRAVAETRSFPMYEYKVMINFRTSLFTDCSEFRLVFLSLSFSSVFSFIFVPSSRFYNVSSFVSLLFSLIFFYSQIYCNSCSCKLQVLLHFIVFTEIWKSLKRDVFSFYR